MGYVAWDGTYRQGPLDLTRHGSSGCDCLECHRIEVQRRRKSKRRVVQAAETCSACGGPIDRQAIDLGLAEDHASKCRYCAEIGFRADVDTRYGKIIFARRGTQDENGYWSYQNYVWPQVVVYGAPEDRMVLPEDKSIEWAAWHFYGKPLRQSLRSRWQHSNLRYHLVNLNWYSVASVLFVILGFLVFLLKVLSRL